MVHKHLGPFALGSECDSIIFEDTLENAIIGPGNEFETLGLGLHVRPMYDSSHVRSLLEEKGYRPIIAQNPRNTKDPA